MSSEAEKRLKESFENIVNVVLCKEISIEVVKKMFKEDINSPRKYSSILSLKDLINILSKRCLLDHLNVVPMLKILQHLGDKELNNLMTEHCKQLYSWNQEHRDPVNLEQQDYAFEWSDELPVKVSDVIAQHIGTDWERFAVGLGLKKADIEQIKSNPSPGKIELCLEAFTLRSKFFKRRHDLLQALSYIKRNDIRWKLQAIFLEQSSVAKIFK